MEWQMRNWLYFTWLSGDHIVEQHIHNIDVVNWAKGKQPIRALGIGGRQVRTDAAFGHIFDHHGVHFEYDDGCWLFSQCRQIPQCHNQVSEHLIGTRGEADFHRGYHLRFRDERAAWSFEGDEPDPYQKEHDDLFAAIRAGAPYNEARYAAESTLTAIMGRMATYSGKLVTREEALASERLGPPEYAWGEIAVPAVPMPGQ
jgi:predicted dehydrogenase